MDKKTKLFAGILGGTAVGIMFSKLFSRKGSMTKQSEKLSASINKKWDENKKDLQQTKEVLEAELEDINEKLQKLA
ncbi:MAG: DUF5320 domain-containing protein [Bacteroidetes bacterium]|nr:DUF5320 domain-containing protein [Bacteroidota bacterium]